MSTETTVQTAPPRPHSVLMIVVLLTITGLAARWSGYLLIPYVVIFAPLLSWVAIIVLAIFLAILAALVAPRGES